MKSVARLPKWFAPLTTFVILMACCLWFLNSYVARVPVPHQSKLADCTNGIADFHFTVPQGHDFCFYLNLTNGSNVPAYRFSGRIRIVNAGSLVTDFPISSDKAWQVDSDFILTGMAFQNTNAPALSQFIQAQKNYAVQITLDPPPPTPSSICLYWLQSGKDLAK